MRDKAGTILYVGKAKNLKARLSSYFTASSSLKTEALVKQIASIDVTLTLSEREALLLENNLIKQHQPRFNVLLRDDKTYPYIAVAPAHPYPRLFMTRKVVPGCKQFGPYSNVEGAKKILDLLFQCFQLRSCEDTDFVRRSRPCLEYQIGKCSAPCVKHISQEAYQAQLNLATAFLSGKQSDLLSDLIKAMTTAAEEKKFEKAAKYRDLISEVRAVVQKQAILGSVGDIDVWGAATGGNAASVAILWIRDGSMIESQSIHLGSGRCLEEDWLEGVLLQYYAEKRPIWPRTILIPQALSFSDALEGILSQRAGHPVQLTHTLSRSYVAATDWLTMAEWTAKAQLEKTVTKAKLVQTRFVHLNSTLNVSKEHPIESIECYDASHAGGNAAYVSQVVFGIIGPLKAKYRLYSLKDTKPGDDYGALKEALRRRVTHSAEEPLPDLLIVDGGKGQLAVAHEVLKDVEFPPQLMAIAKGPARKSGLEHIYLWEEGEIKELQIKSDSPTFTLIQQLRNEAHRFAIKAHRAKRRKGLLEIPFQIPGLGEKRYTLLLQHFGGLKGLQEAREKDIAQIPGIGPQLANRIWQALHKDLA